MARNFLMLLRGSDPSLLHRAARIMKRSDMRRKNVERQVRTEQSDSLQQRDANGVHQSGPSPEGWWIWSTSHGETGNVRFELRREQFWYQRSKRQPQLSEQSASPMAEVSIHLYLPRVPHHAKDGGRVSGKRILVPTYSFLTPRARGDQKPDRDASGT
ncbi:uncharacterized protein EI90DRAFT_3011394 [Cantharellus anzutake]|uniref:uncharacterized protein n=1 Tax=Cantharellus anzutake TaxID=1750568 RepID=UPI0019062AA7|nr:uncharacterized protein EI90DRAFT_3011394 [Cantharellus anzutake]KAF8342978.1 hypothetical protein EI90DRAFT_3011394 [Cantharellus anzutake]